MSLSPGDRPVLLCAAPGVPARGPSGASAHLRGIATALRPVALVVARASDRRGVAAEPAVPVVEVGVPGWPSWLDPWRDVTEMWTARRAARAVRALDPTLVWERHSLYSDAGRRVHTATGAPWILEVNAPLAQERARYEQLRRPASAAAWERDVVCAAPRVIAVSAWLADWCRNLGARQVLHVPNGVAPLAGDRAGTRDRLRLADRLVLGFVGSGRAWHGVERIAALLDALPQATVLIAGEARLDHPRAVNLGVLNGAALADAVAAMDVGLAPYGPDAPPWFCPLKLLDYRAQGTPVVAPDLGDCRSLVGGAGAVLPTWNLDDAVDAIRAWAGRRCPPHARSWDTVVSEALA
jgi:glycosyltransferase involved in cell wall biosynthesis